mgnify:CR=1 FL=1
MCKETKDCKHKFVHKETIRERISYGRSNSRSENFRKVDLYFCEKCLEEKSTTLEWCGQEHYSDCPEWVKQGIFINKVIW